MNGRWQDPSVARLPVDAPLPRPCLPLRQEDAC